MRRTGRPERPRAVSRSPACARSRAWPSPRSGSGSPRKRLSNLKRQGWIDWREEKPGLVYIERKWALPDLAVVEKRPQRVESRYAVKAVNALAGNAVGLNALHSPPSIPLTSPTLVTLELPPGRYSVTDTLELNSFSCLRGQGRAVLQTDDATIPILRSRAAWCDIENISFVGGLHSIALYGPSAFYGGYYSPTAFGNVPCRIRGCDFVYPAGPAIWQDTSPVTTIAPNSNGQTIPLPNLGTTLFVTSTVGFSNSGGTASIQDSDGNLHSITYTGTGPGSLLGCQSVSDNESGLLTTGCFVGGANFRAFQTVLRVSDFYFAGASLFWGFGDSMTFINGHVAWDFSNAQTTGDHLPLGLFNSADDLLVW